MSAFNLSTMLAEIIEKEDHPPWRPCPAVKRRLPPNFCLPARLPSTRILQREADTVAPKTLLQQSQRSPSPPNHESIEEALSHSIVDSASIKSSSPVVSSLKQTLSRTTSRTSQKEWKEPESFEVFKAIEHKDVMFLMEVRDKAFHLLVRPSQFGVSPLVFAMRIGKSHQEVAIVLVGAFSRFANNLSDEGFQTKETKDVLKNLRISLKQAIDFGLYAQQSDLIASFMQTLIMSEGDQWVVNTASDVALALRSGTDGQPVATAQKAVRRFATRELGKAQSIAALEDYVANATADLLMMGAWQIALDFVEDEVLPYYYFARDDRVYKAFIEHLDKHKSILQRSASRRLKWQIRVLRSGLDGRQTTWRSKVELLAEELDQGAGV